MPARIAAIRVQNQWSVRAPYIQCMVRLTRPLTPEETAALNAHSEFVAVEDVISYTCRPEDVEETEQRLSALLRRVHRATNGLSAADRQVSVLDR